MDVILVILGMVAAFRLWDAVQSALGELTAKPRRSSHKEQYAVYDECHWPVCECHEERFCHFDRGQEFIAYAYTGKWVRD